MKTKKSLHPKLHSRTPGRFPAFGAQFLHGGTILASREGVVTRFYGVDLDSCPQIQGWSQAKKKGLRYKIWGFIIVFNRAFVLEQKCTYAWRGNKQYFQGGTGLEKHFSGTGPVHIFFLGGTSSDKMGKAPKCPQWCWAWVGPWQQKVGWLGRKSGEVLTSSGKDLCWVSCLCGFFRQV